MRTIIPAALLLAATFSVPAHGQGARAMREGISPLATPESRIPIPDSRLQGPADSLYRVAREALNRNEYGRAADLFNTLRTRYPKSDYSGDAYYWEAYARYRMGGMNQLRTALALLDEQEQKRPNADTRDSGDAARETRSGADRIRNL